MLTKTATADVRSDAIHSLISIANIFRKLLFAITIYVTYFLTKK